jgi:hypothetical protein
MKAVAFLLPIIIILYISLTDWHEWDISNIILRINFIFVFIATAQIAYGWTANVDLDDKEIEITHSVYHIPIYKKKGFVKSIIKEEKSINYFNIKSFFYPMNTIWIELKDGYRIRLFDDLDGEMNWERIISDFK